MKKNFLRLHNTETNTVLILNADLIAVIDTETISNNKICSKIFLKGDAEINEFTVNETPEKIYDMMPD